MACKIRIRVKKEKYIRGDNTTMKYTSIIIPFVGGLGMFIYGMQIMAQGLENAAGNRMKSLLEALTKNKFFGVLLGSVHYRSDPELICDDRHGSRFCKCRYHEPSAGDGSYHGCEHRYNSYRMLVSSVEWAKF